MTVVLRPGDVMLDTGDPGVKRIISHIGDDGSVNYTFISRYEHSVYTMDAPTLQSWFARGKMTLAFPSMLNLPEGA